MEFQLTNGLRKDHKVNWDAENGPPLRPLCNAKLGPNAPLGNLVSNRLKPVKEYLVEEIGTEIITTEDLRRSLDDYNEGAQEVSENRRSERGAYNNHKYP